MKKILSIDGGGIKGVFPASFLASLEEQIPGGSIWEYFDLIAGTSTGGIIALALGLGFSPREILSMYEDNAEKIFPKKKWGNILQLKENLRVRGLFKQKYDTAPLADILKSRFQNKLLGHSKTRLMICATHLQTGKVNVFKTAHSDRLKNDYKVSAVHVALATSAAPVFFTPHKMPNGHSLVDGAMWGNNPMGFAAIEGVHFLGWDPKDTAILSVGCTEESPSFATLAGEKIGAAQWGLGLVECFMTSQSYASLGMAIHVLEDLRVERVRRVTETVPKNMFPLDGTERLDALKGLGDSKARDEISHLGMFFEEKAEPFVPVYSTQDA